MGSRDEGTSLLPPGSGTRPWIWVAAAALALAALFAYAVGQTRSHVTRIGRTPVRTYHLATPSTVPAGTSLTVSGSLASGTNGPIVVEGSWDAGPWVSLGSTNVQNGGYRVRYRLAQRGHVQLRIEFPNGDEGLATVDVT